MFAFQGSRWLVDTLSEILTDAQRAGLAKAKDAAQLWAEAEALTPKELPYRKGWPEREPTRNYSRRCG